MLSYEPNRKYTMNDIVKIIIENKKEDIFRYALKRNLNVYDDELSTEYLCEMFDKKFCTEEWWTDSLSSYRISLFLDDLYCNIDKYCFLYYILSDNLSKDAMISEMCYRIFAAFEKCIPTEEGLTEYFNRLFNFSKEEVYVDCGAFVGDSIVDFLKYNDGYAKRIYAFECMPSTFKRLKLNLEIEKEVPNELIVMRQCAVSNKEKMLYFDIINDNRMFGAYSSPSGKFPVAAVSLDKEIAEPITFIKMDIEGSECEAIWGARKHISEDHPKMAICLYHKPDDFWRVPFSILECNQNYSFFIRRHSVIDSSKEYFTPWDCVLYCVPKFIKEQNGCAENGMRRYFKKRFPLVGIEQGICYDEKFIDIFERVRKAKKICCWGLGKLFKEHFRSKSIDSSLWIDKVKLLTDSRVEMWGQNIDGLQIVSPNELKSEKDLLIITYVLEDTEIKEQLAKLGFDNVIHIFDLFKLIGKRYDISEEGDVYFY